MSLLSRPRRAREAKNGAQFIDKAEEALGAHIDVLSGKQEARIRRPGVMAGIPEADGVVGDLGGGSLELIDIRDGEIRDGVTLPIGPLRLIDMSGGIDEKARAIVDDTLKATKLLENLRGRQFYAVGGTWRNLAKIHMAQNHYPLHVLHHYRMTREAGPLGRRSRLRAFPCLAEGCSPRFAQQVRHLALRRHGS